MSRSLVAPVLFAVVALAACGGATSGEDAIATTVDPVTTSSGGTVTSGEGGSPRASTTTTASTNPSTTHDAAVLGPVPSTTEREPFAVEWDTPEGSFEFGDFAVVARLLDGTLVLIDDPRAGASSTVLFEDLDGALPDDADVVGVGGVVEGALVLDVCCGTRGGLWALDEPDGRLRRFADGHAPTFSLGRNWLVALDADGAELLVHDVPSGLVTSPELGSSAEEQAVVPPATDVIWAPDEASMFVLTEDDGQTELLQIDARPPFDVLASVDVTPLFAGAVNPPVLVGRGPGGEIGLSAVVGDDTVISFVDAATRAERPDRERTLPPDATSVRLGPDGAALMWIVDGSLRFLPLFEEERTLLDGVVDAWFVR